MNAGAVLALQTNLWSDKPMLFGTELLQAERLPVADAELSFVADFLDSQRAADTMKALIAELAWHREELVMYGRRVTVPRLIAWYGDANAQYRYSGVDHQPLRWTETLTRLRDSVQAACQARFNSVLANRYRDGADAMGWHSDNEPELGPAPTIASLSLGASRRMRFRHRRRSHLPQGFDLPAGSLLVMRGATQDNWQHCITRTAKPVGERLNLTFRLIRDANKDLNV